MTTVSFCAFDKPGFVGGTSRWIQQLLPALQSRGMKVRCYVFLHTGEEGPVTRHLKNNGVECITTFAHAYAEDRVQWLLEQLRDDPPDVFVPNEVPAAYHASRWVKAAGIPTVGVVHSDGEVFKVFQSLFISSPRSNALTAIVCVSRFIEETVRRNNGSGIRVERIVYGADIPQTTVPPPRDVLRIAYVGRLTEEQKQISGVARALCSAVRLIPGVEATLYGDGPSRKAVEEIIASEGENLPVTLAGHLNRDDLQRALLETHVVVLLSDYEGLPVALTDAMACGCVPVCLTIPSGIPELVVDGVTGFLVDDRGPSFVEAIRKLRDDAGLWTTLSMNARRHTENEYTLKAGRDAWFALLNELGKQSSPTELRIPRQIRIAPAIPPYEGPLSRKPRVSPVVLAYRALRMNLGRVRQRLMASGGARS